MGTELDIILHDLLNEEGLMDTELDNIDVEFIKPFPDVLISEKQVPKYHFNLNLIFLICFLVSSASIFFIILACTTCHCYRKVNTDEVNVDKIDKLMENTLLRAGSKILWEGRRKRRCSRPEQWI